MSHDFEFYETPDPFTRWLFNYMSRLVQPIAGRICEPCVGNGAIVRASGHSSWWTNDLDARWGADAHLDAADETLWRAHAFDWTVTNPPFSAALEIAEHAIKYTDCGVAMHLRASIHEVLKTGTRRTWMSRQTPTGILWLPRFAYQRSRTTGKWTTDSVCACWVIWMGEHIPQFIAYAPESVIDELDAFTPEYRARMDEIMNFTGSEQERQAQCKARWSDAPVEGVA